MKKIMAACYDRYLEFDTDLERKQYLSKLESDGTTFFVIGQHEESGKFRLRVQQRYNFNPMYQEVDHNGMSKSMEEFLSAMPQKQLYAAICAHLPASLEDPSGICCLDGEEILFRSQANCCGAYAFLKAFGCDVSFGQYTPEEDRRNAEEDELTGLYYIH